jgi:hypothetical protein
VPSLTRCGAIIVIFARRVDVCALSRSPGAGASTVRPPYLIPNAITDFFL